MERRVLLTLGGCMTAALVGAAPPPVSASPKAHTRLIAAATPSSPQVFTLRYVAFVAHPKSAAVAAQFSKGCPPVLTSGLYGNPRYAMTATPAGFLGVLQGDQPDYVFNLALAGSVTLPNSDGTPVQISDGPNPVDSHALTLTDAITVSSNADGTLDLKSEGKASFTGLVAPLTGPQAWGWKGENNAVMLGRTYLWGARSELDGTVITWAFCILPGQVDQVASTWNRSNGARRRVVALGKKAMAVQKRVGNE